MKRDVTPWPLSDLSRPELSRKAVASVSGQTERSNARELVCFLPEILIGLIKTQVSP